ncbi:MAG: hypothetical protein LC777_17820 [Actinobacteria bacterium]|nr:hypothetical protein [Actinomycetota bacterium]
MATVAASSAAGWLGGGVLLGDARLRGGQHVVGGADLRRAGARRWCSAACVTLEARVSATTTSAPSTVDDDVDA